jgi:hypothetical protein
MIYYNAGAKQLLLVYSEESARTKLQLEGSNPDK